MDPALYHLETKQFTLPYIIITNAAPETTSPTGIIRLAPENGFTLISVCRVLTIIRLELVGTSKVAICLCIGGVCFVPSVIDEVKGNSVLSIDVVDASSRRFISGCKDRVNLRLVSVDVNTDVVGAFRVIVFWLTVMSVIDMWAASETDLITVQTSLNCESLSIKNWDPATG